MEQKEVVKIIRKETAFAIENCLVEEFTHEKMNVVTVAAAIMLPIKDSDKDTDSCFVRITKLLLTKDHKELTNAIVEAKMALTRLIFDAINNQTYCKPTMLNNAEWVYGDFELDSSKYEFIKGLKAADHVKLKEFRVEEKSAIV